MKRRKSENADSLDMLLDTVSNLFGCIIFLTLFVSILTGKASQVAQEKKENKNISIAFLEKKIQIRERQIESMYNDKNMLDSQDSMFQEIKDYEIELIEAQHWKEGLKKRLAVVKAKKDKLKKRSLSVDEMTESLEREMKQIEDQIENARSTIKKNSQLPRFGFSGKKKSIDFWVTGGRMYAIFSKKDCVVLSNDGFYNVFLLEDKGSPSGGFNVPPIDINLSWPSLRWRSIVKNKPPAIYQANFYIAPDSADAYLNFVQRFEKKGYAIRPTLLSRVEKTLQLITVDSLMGQ